MRAIVKMGGIVAVGERGERVEEKGEERRGRGKKKKEEGVKRERMECHSAHHAPLVGGFAHLVVINSKMLRFVVISNHNG